MRTLLAQADLSAHAIPAGPDARLPPALFLPLDRLLLRGGDSRLSVSSPDGLNVYGCKICPWPELSSFGSTTASTISARAYARAERARAELIERTSSAAIDRVLDDRLEEIRETLKLVLGLQREAAEIVFSPSGTDAQLLALFAAQATLGGPLTSVVVAADQTGSGTAYTAAGCHFDCRSALCAPVGKGGRISGFGAVRDSISIALHDEGRIPCDLDAIDGCVEAAVARAVGDGHRVLLQTMDRSKLGWRAPSEACIHSILTRWPDSVQVVVDACQGRLSGRRIAAYLQRGFIVLLTGSKFFGGPAFSGAMLVPPRVGHRLAAAQMPGGLCDYSCLGDWPPAWRGLRSQLSRPYNLGAWLRWEAALAEMQSYFAIPIETRRRTLARLAHAIASRIETSNALEMLPAQASDDSDGMDDDEFSSPTVFPFLVRRDGKVLREKACLRIWRWLHRDASTKLSADATTHARDLSRHLYQLGRPVTVGKRSGERRTYLRLSTGARLVSECWSPDESETDRRVEAQIAKISDALQKTELLISHLSDIE